MSHRLTTAIIAALALCAPAAAQDKPAPARQPAAKPATGEKPKSPPAELSPGMQAEMEAWKKAAEPGPEHKQLEQFAGEWEATVKSTWEPGMPPEEATATLRAHMDRPGRFVIINFRGTMMGDPLIVQQVMGFNNITRKFESTSRDNMSTGMMFETGTGDSAGKVFTLNGEYDEPGGKKVKTRTVYTFTGDGAYRAEMWQVGAGPDGKDHKMMEMTCKRTKAASRPGADDDEDDARPRVRPRPRDGGPAPAPARGPANPK